MENENVLQRPTLVLNRNWQPIHVTPLRRALTMVTRDTARVVDPTSYELLDWLGWTGRPTVGIAIRTTRGSLAVPDVIALTRYDRLPLRQVSFCKRNVLKRDRHTCQYCGAQPGQVGLTIDHVVPKARGGDSSWSNCVSACEPCNRQKADRLLRDVGMRLRQPPRRPTWQPWFSQAASRPSWTPFVSSPVARRPAS